MGRFKTHDERLIKKLRKDVKRLADKKTKEIMAVKVKEAPQSKTAESDVD